MPSLGSPRGLWSSKGHAEKGSPAGCASGSSALAHHAGWWLLAGVLCALTVLIPGQARGQSGCDPTVSNCSGANQQTQSGFGSGVPTTTEPNGQPVSPFGNEAGGYDGNRTYGGALPSTELQPVPTFTDNLIPDPRNQLGTAAQTGGNSTPRVLTPDQPTEFQRLVSASVGRMLPIFGAKLFLQSPSTFAPIDQVPVTSTYVVGPGDVLLIRVWGQINFNAEVKVDRSGFVYLPQVGAIHVGGVSYDKLAGQVRDNVARIFKNFDLSVNLGQLHPIRIFVTGQARHPGTYVISSVSTLVSALFSTGGPAPQGTMRHIQLRRDGVTVADYDMYDLLVNGDKSHDVPLLPGDVIYIPAVGPQVAVFGSVRAPAIYELKQGDGAAGKPTTVGDLLEEAGGLSSLASLTRASLERISEDRHQRVVNIALDSAGKSTTLQDGDILRVLPISPSYEQTVTVRGNLADPGRFGWHPGMKLSELLPNSAALVTRDYWQRRNRLGLPSPVFEPDYTQRFQTYRNTQAARQLQYQQSLQRQVQRKALGLPDSPADQKSDQTIAQGELATDIPFSSLDPGSPEADAAQAEADANAPQVPDSVQAAPNAQQPGQNAPSGNQNNNNNIINNIIGGGSLADQQRSTRTENTAGATTINNVKLAVPEIDWSYAVIERLDAVTLQTHLIPFDLGKLVIEHDPGQDLELEPHDVVTIFSQADIRVPQQQQTKLVRIEGEVKHAGIYSAEPGETLRHLVERAGGLTPKAYLFGAELTRESARIIQQQRLDDYVTRLELDIDRSAAATTARAASPQDQAAAATSLSSSQVLVARLRQLRANGRVVLSIDPDAADVSKLPEVPLEDGDRLIVPARPSSVNVLGEVYEQSSFLFDTHLRVYGYLKQAGGAGRDADPSHAFIVRADGSVLSRESAKTFWGNEFDQARVHPGDTIVMPEKVYRGSSFRNALTYSSLFSSVALGAASLAVILP
jgi:protein involved in polysaccharide export with SLBB domain